ncbi:hypothetical protein [Streptomyces cadmiisoli]|uniref:hypothetical protein n=1 Tax=Streptomyces cadmiisoli TaxID=2184053 RepID=UPI0036599486
MTTRFDDGPEFGADDPLAVILRPSSDRLGPPPGRYEAIRRAAARRRLLRAAVGAGLTCAVAVLVALPLHLAAPGAPASPSVPLAPPPASGSGTTPEPSVSPTVPPSSPTPPSQRSSPVPSASASPSPSRPGPSRTYRRTSARDGSTDPAPGVDVTREAGPRS